jgi:hypothetical protein
VSIHTKQHEKSRVTAVGPYRIFTDFPIIPKAEPESRYPCVEDNYGTLPYLVKIKSTINKNNYIQFFTGKIPENLYPSTEWPTGTVG